MSIAADGESIHDLIRALRPELRAEVRDFVEGLLERQKAQRRERLSLSWAGGLEEFRDRFTARELQKKSLEWWGT